jgi:hypothetical protein
MRTPPPVSINDYLGEPITVTEVVFPRIETYLMRFRHSFNLFSPHVDDIRGTRPLIIGQRYEISLVPIILPTPAAILVKFVEDQGCTFTGISGLLNLYHQHPELFTPHNGRYIVSMVNDKSVNDFPRISIPPCRHAQVNFGFHTVISGRRNDFHSSSIVLLFKEL